MVTDGRRGWVVGFGRASSIAFSTEAHFLCLSRLHMQSTNIENDPGYVPTAGLHVRSVKQSKG